MMIPMISIDGLSGSVVRDGPGITQTQAMCLGMLVGQNKECGEAFEAAVEKFQQMMAEGLSGESGISGDEAPRAVTTAVPHVVVEVPVAVKKAETPVVAEVPVAVAASVTTQQVATSATLPLEGVAERPVVVEKVVTPVVAERPVVVEKVVTPVAIEVPVAVATSATLPLEGVAERPVVVEKVVTPVVAERPVKVEKAATPVAVEVPVAVATSATLPVEGVTERPVAVEKVATPVAVEVSVAVATSATLPLEGVAEKPVVVEKAVTPVAVEVPVAVATSATTQQVATSATLPLEGTPEKSPKGNGVLVADEIVERTESASSDRPEPQVIDFRNVLIQPSQGGVDGVAMEKRVFTPAQVLVDAAAAVADTITVSPEVLRGASEVQVQLRPDVLEGTVIRIATTVPGTLTVQFTPVTENMAALLEKCAPQLVTYLSERIHNVQIAVNVKRDEKLKG